MGIAERVWFGIRRLISQLGSGRWRVERESPFDIVDMLDESSLKGCMLADASRSQRSELTKDTDSQVLGHGARLNSHSASRRRYGWLSRCMFNNYSNDGECEVLIESTDTFIDRQLRQ